MADGVIGHAMLEVGASSEGVEAGLAAGASALKRFSVTARDAGTSAATGMDQIGLSAEAAAVKVTKANSGMVNQIKNAIAQQQSLGKSMSDGFEIKAAVKGISPESIAPFVSQLRQLETANRLAAESASFDKQIAEAAKLRKASEYVLFWNNALEQKEIADRKAATQNSFLSSLDSQVSMIGKTRTELLAIQAAQLGVSEKAAPMIAKMHEWDNALKRGGVSAGQTRQAMAMLPAQMTDIVTQLAGGQSPFLIMIQQGGQLKDSFGGIGPMLRGVGGALLSTTGATLSLAAGVGALAFAWKKGADEAREYQKAIVMSGNYAAVSASGLSASQKGVALDSGATNGAAAGALTSIVATGTIAGGAMNEIAVAALKMEKATGKAVAETIKEFAELADAPLDASLKFNKSENYMTAGLYLRLRALQDMHRFAEAAELAERARAEALNTRAQQVVDNAGLMEKAWRGVADSSKNAWDRMLDVGRPQKKNAADATATELARLKKQLAILEDEETASSRDADNGALMIGEQEKQQLKDKIALRQQLLEIQREDQRLLGRLATLQEAEATRQAEIKKRGVEASKWLADKYEENFKGQARINRDLDVYNGKVKEATAALGQLNEERSRLLSEEGGEAKNKERIEALDKEAEAYRVLLTAKNDVLAKRSIVENGKSESQKLREETTREFLQSQEKAFLDLSTLNEPVVKWKDYGVMGDRVKSLLASFGGGNKDQMDKKFELFGVEEGQLKGFVDQLEKQAAALDRLDFLKQFYADIRQNRIKSSEEITKMQDDIESFLRFGESKKYNAQEVFDRSQEAKDLALKDAIAGTSERQIRSQQQAKIDGWNKTKYANTYLFSLKEQEKSISRQVQLLGMSTHEQEKQQALWAAEDAFLKSTQQLRADEPEYERQKLAYLEQQQKITASLDAKRAFDRDPVLQSKKALEEYADDAANLGKQTAEAWTNAFKNMEDSMVNFCMTGKLDFKSFANSVIADIIRIQIRSQITGPMAQSMSGSSAMGGVGNIGSWLAGLFGFGSGVDMTGFQSAPIVDGFGGSSIVTTPAVTSSVAGMNWESMISGSFADGGTAQSGNMYRVNERGPELLTVGGRDYLMMGAQSGSVTPNEKLGGKTTTVNVKVNQTFAPGTDQRTIDQSALAVARAIARAQRKNG